MTSRRQLDEKGARLLARAEAWDAIYVYLLSHHRESALADILAAEQEGSARWRQEVEALFEMNNGYEIYAYLTNDDDKRSSLQAGLPVAMKPNKEAVRHVLQLVSHLPSGEALWTLRLARQELWNTRRTWAERAA